MVVKMLRLALGANVAFSLCCGSLALLYIKQLQNHIPLPTVLLGLAASGLIGFAVLLTWVRSDQNRSLNMTLSIILVDISWVVASSILATIFHHHLSSAGLALVVFTNLCVASLALAQSVGLKKAKRSSTASTYPR